MPSYQKRGANSFLLTVEAGYNEKGKRIRKTRTIRINDEALLKTTRKLENYLQKELAKFQMEVEAGEYISPDKRKFSDFAEDWYQKYAIKNLAERTHRGYKHLLDRYIVPRFGGRKLEDIKPIHIVNFMDDLTKAGAAINKAGKPLADSSLYQIDKTLRVVFNKAVEWQVIKKSPLENLQRPQVKKKKMKYLEEEDVIDLIVALYKEPINWRLFFLTAAISGMRRGEILGLEWDDIDFEQGEIQLTKTIPFFENGKPHIKSTKTEEDMRTISMPEWYMKELSKYKLEWQKEKMKVGELWEGGDHNFLFHRGFGVPYIPSSVNKTWTNLKKRHNLKDIRFHDLRHTMVTYLLQEGESIKHVQERVGHSSSKITTDIYGHVTKKGSKATAKRFDKFNPEDIRQQSVNNRN